MQLLLTDRLVCPRCGPPFGLILLANEMVDRRVLDGVLGCPNCRDSFRIAEGFADLREPPRGDLGEGLAGAASPWSSPAGETESRIVALLGIARGPGTVALVGEAARVAGALVDAVEDLDAVVVDADTRFWPDRPHVSRMTGEPRLPFFTGMLRGVAIDGRLGDARLEEAARVIGPRARVVVIRAGETASRTLGSAGLSILAEEGETIVAARS